MKINWKYILIVLVILVVIYYIYHKDGGSHIQGSCPPGTKWNGQFCDTPNTCQNRCFMSKAAHIDSKCPDDSNLGDCLNAWCAKKCK